MSESLTGWTHKLRLLEESAILLSQAIAATITPLPTISQRGKLKVTVSGTDPSGSVTITGLDGSTVVTDTLAFLEARDLITDYFYTAFSSIVTSSLTGTITITLVDEANQDINVQTESDPYNCTFREVAGGSRLYETFGIVDSSLFYLRAPRRVGLDSDSVFEVIGFDGSFKVARPVRKLFLPGTKICREVETYATNL